MIFEHTYPWVVATSPYTGRPKTQTRRIVKPGQYQRRDFELPDSPIVQVAHTKTGWVGTGTPVVYNVGSTYAVQPARTAKAIARIRLLSIRREDVRYISDEDVVAEGFSRRCDFLMVWVKMHDKGLKLNYHPHLDFFTYVADGREYSGVNAEYMQQFLLTRPAHRYDAWALTFEVVK